MGKVTLAVWSPSILSRVHFSLQSCGCYAQETWIKLNMDPMVSSLTDSSSTDIERGDLGILQSGGSNASTHCLVQAEAVIVYKCSSSSHSADDQ